MEPRPLGRGMGRWGRRGEGGRGASMEPRPLGRGMHCGTERRIDTWAASMEPRPLGRGMSLRLSPFSTSIYSFNGATTSRSWNVQVRDQLLARGVASMEPRPLGRGMPSRHHESQHWTVLQWSRDLSVVECNAIPCRRRTYRRASMEPRPLGRGMLPTTLRRFVWAFELQWSHDLSVVECTDYHARAVWRRLLQWSHDLSVVECHSWARTRAL